MTAALAGVDRAAVARAAGLTLAVLVPPVLVIRALVGGDDDSRLWTLIPLAFVVSFLLGGGYAARQAPTAPVKHGALAGAVAFGAALVFAVLRNVVTGWSMGIAALVTAVLFWQIATSLAALGALVASRRTNRINKEVGPA